MTTQYLAADIERDEGSRLKAYLDSQRVWTIGVGHNIEADPDLMERLPSLVAAGISEDESQALLNADIATASAALDVHLSWWRKLDDVRQDAIVNLAFNLGEAKLATWSHTLGDIESGLFKAAAVDLENDEPWASQVHDRAKRIAFQIETGVRAWTVSEAEIEAVLSGQVEAPINVTVAPEAPPQPLPAPLPYAQPQPPQAAPGPPEPVGGAVPPLPSIPKSLVGSAIRHGLTGLGFLAPFLGSLSSDQLNQLVGWLTGVVFVSGPLIWAWWKARQHKAAVAAALATPAPGQTVSTLSDADVARIAAAVAASHPA